MYRAYRKRYGMQSLYGKLHRICAIQFIIVVIIVERGNKLGQILHIGCSKAWSEISNMRVCGCRR